MTAVRPGSLRRITARAAVAAALAGTPALAACGGDDSGDAGAVSPPSGGGDRAERVVIEAEEGAFDPKAVYDAAAPGVVTIRSIFGAGEDLGGLFGGRRSAGQGSGFVLSDDGEIVTNAHVVTNAEAVGAGGNVSEAKEVYVEFADRNQVPAEIVGFDPFADVGLIKVDPEGLDLVPLELGESAEVEVGQPVAAIGSPFGEEQSLSVGFVSATDRSIESLTDFQIDAAIQTDASINPGNSGGPLLDAEARVLGINQQINTTSGADAGVGFAVPSDLVQRSIEALREDGEPDYAYIGVTSQPLYPQLAERLDIPSPTGSLLAEVVPGSPADDAGLEAGDDKIRFQGQPVDVGGDVIVSVDGERIVRESDLPQLIAQHRPGDEITLEVIRDGERQEVEVTLEERPDRALR